MTSSLASRLGDIPGVASVVVDLEGFGRGIDVRLEPGANEVEVMEKLRALLAAYGVRHERRESTRSANTPRKSDPSVDVVVTPSDGSVRIEVSTGTVRSFRVVAPEPIAVAQGLADAWCQVIGRIPVEVVSVEVDAEDDELIVVAFDGEHESKGSASISGGWVNALTSAVGGLLGDAGKPDLKRAAS
jgi:hypothetical protein